MATFSRIGRAAPSRRQLNEYWLDLAGKLNKGSSPTLTFKESLLSEVENKKNVRLINNLHASSTKQLTNIINGPDSKMKRCSSMSFSMDPMALARLQKSCTAIAMGASPYLIEHCRILDFMFLESKMCDKTLQLLGY